MIIELTDEELTLVIGGLIVNNEFVSALEPVLAPVTDTFAQAPRTGGQVTPGFQPYMIGD